MKETLLEGPESHQFVILSSNGGRQELCINN